MTNGFFHKEMMEYKNENEEYWDRELDSGSTCLSAYLATPNVVPLPLWV